nr:PREDICTED: beta-1,3-galactosyltransferase 5-like [Bemisia tabaci]
MVSKKPRVFYSLGVSFVIFLVVLFSLHKIPAPREQNGALYDIQRLHDNRSNVNQSSKFSLFEDIKIKTPSQIEKPQGQPNSADIGQTRNLYEFGFDIPNIALCPDLGTSLKILILILSAPSHMDKRMAIRQTWAGFARRKDIQLSFFLGRTTSDLVSKIEEESSVFGDIIAGRFIDTYRNLTLKTTSIMEWIDHYCPKVKYILKTDDDMFINVPKLLGFVASHQDSKRTFFGKLAKSWGALRDFKSKYYVSPEQFAPSHYPDFVTGPAYLFTSDIVRESYVEALRAKFMPLEDVFMTGLVAQVIKVTHVHCPEFYNWDKKVGACEMKHYISVGASGTQGMFDLYKKLLDSPFTCG